MAQQQHGFFFPYSGPPHSVRRWLDERGMDASESSSEVISRAAVFDFYLKSTLHSLYVPEVEELEPLMSRPIMPESSKLRETSLVMKVSRPPHRAS